MYIRYVFGKTFSYHLNKQERRIRFSRARQEEAGDSKEPPGRGRSLEGGGRRLFLLLTRPPRRYTFQK